MLLLRLAWGWYTGFALQRHLARLRANHHPTTAAELTFPQVPAADNAFTIHAQAYKALAAGVASPSQMDESTPLRPPFQSTWLAAAEKSETAHAAAFPLARQARSRSRAQLRNSLPSPVFTILLPYLHEMRNLAATLWDGAVFLHLQGNDDEAVERLLDSLHVARSLRADDFRVTQLVAGGVEMRISTAARIIFSNAKPAGRPTTRPVAPAKVKLLIAQLLDEQPARDGVERGLVMDQLLYIDYFSTASAENWVLRPLAQREMIRSLRNCDLLLRASRCASKPEADEILKDYREEKSAIEEVGWPPRYHTTHIPRYSRWFRNWKSSGDYLRMHFRHLAERRSTALALAIWLYRADHGRWPADLATLVPDYLPSIPIDPYQSGARPIGYLIVKLPGNLDRPLLVFGTGPHAAPAEPTYGTTLGDVNLPQYRDLTFFDPALLKKAVDHQPDKPNAPGQNSQ